MQRYFIQPEQVQQQQVEWSGDDVHHIKTVMRGQMGDRLICCTGQGVDYEVEIMQMNAHKIVGSIVRMTPSLGEPRTKVTIAQSLPKGDKWEWVLQKATEMGATRFIPFISERTVVKIDAWQTEKKMARWRRIVKEAAEQAHRGIIPAVVSPFTWKQWMGEIRPAQTVWLAYEKGGRPLAECMQVTNAEEILLMIGPEGGFTEAEVVEATAAGAVPLTLGKRILRAETAPLVALSCILFARGELGR
jgi:16S rRNA (uracil1498-N3)-methyltransferase